MITSEVESLQFGVRIIEQFGVRTNTLNHSLLHLCVQEVHTKDEVVHLTPGLLGLGVLFNCHA